MSIVAFTIRVYLHGLSPLSDGRDRLIFFIAETVDKASFADARSANQQNVKLYLCKDMKIHSFWKCFDIYCRDPCGTGFSAFATGPSFRCPKAY